MFLMPFCVHFGLAHATALISYGQTLPPGFKRGEGDPQIPGEPTFTLPYIKNRVKHVQYYFWCYNEVLSHLFFQSNDFVLVHEL